MKFAVLSVPSQTDTRDELREQQEAELDHMRADGFLLQIFRRNDGLGAISFIEAVSEEAALRRLNSMPFVTNRAITLEVFPVTPRFPCTCALGANP